jgi:CubicO group peptidase (beta-lactamase class C family)
VADGAGLTSAAHDYGRFLEMIRNGGVLDDVRILAPRTVALMTSNQSGTALDFKPLTGMAPAGWRGSAHSVGAEPTERPTKSMCKVTPFWY